MTHFKVESLSLVGLNLIQREKKEDSRGDFSRLFCDEELSITGWESSIKQINLTNTISLGTIRGLHYQNQPSSEMKIVTCLKGAIWDVAVDLRSESDTFLEWHSEILSEENQRSLSIPKGFAHGFQSLTPNVDVLYFHSESYDAHSEAGIRYNDPAVGIEWPMQVATISERDLSHPLLNEHFKGVKLK